MGEQKMSTASPFDQRNTTYTGTPIATRRWEKDGAVHYALWDAWRVAEYETHDEAIEAAQEEICWAKLAPIGATAFYRR